MKYLIYIVALTIALLSACSTQTTLMWEPQEQDGDEKLLNVDPPVYPLSLQKAGIEGYVLIQFSINEFGRVYDAFIVEEYPVGVFSEFALDHVYSSLYKPALLNGNPVKVESKKRWVDFTLSGGRYTGQIRAKGEREPVPENPTCKNTKSKIVETEKCSEW